MGRGVPCYGERPGTALTFLESAPHAESRFIHDLLPRMPVRFAFRRVPTPRDLCDLRHLGSSVRRCLGTWPTRHSQDLYLPRRPLAESWRLRSCHRWRRSTKCMKSATRKRDEIQTQSAPARAARAASSRQRTWGEDEQGCERRQGASAHPPQHHEYDRLQANQ